jgi:transposase
MNYNAKYVVRLTEEERVELQGLVRRGKVAAAKRSRAQVLLKADAGLEGSGSTDEQVAQALEVSTRSVNRVRKAYVEEGLSAAIERQPRHEQPRRKLDGAAEAQLVAVACSPPPAGQTRWTLRLLSDKLVELQVVESISRECVRQTLKKTISSHG